MRTRSPLDAQEQYMDNTTKHRLLGRAEEFELITKAQAGDKEARDTIILCNQKLVVNIAVKYTNLCGALDLMDLVQWGNIGIMIAIERFDLSKGFRFSTYATWWIRSILRRNGLIYGNQMSVSSGATELMVRMPTAIGTLLQNLKRDPTIEELAEFLKVNLETAKAVHTLLITNLSLDGETFGGKEGSKTITLEEVVPAEIEPAHDCLERKETHTEIVHALSHLTDEQRTVMIKRYGLDGSKSKTLREIGKDIGKSREMVRLIEMKAEEYLKTSLTYAFASD